MNPHGRRAAKAQTPPALLLNRQICHLSLTLRGGLCLKQESCYVHKKNNNNKKKRLLFIVAAQIKPCSERCVDVLG